MLLINAMSMIINIHFKSSQISVKVYIISKTIRQCSILAKKVTYTCACNFKKIHAQNLLHEHDDDDKIHAQNLCLNS